MTLYINQSLNIYRVKHKYPQNDQEWGYYLAGLIDADGCFTDVSKHKPNLTICFHIKDIHLAYKIKSFLGYGTVSKIKNKNACKYVLTKKQGFLRLLSLLKNKLRHLEKIRRYLLLYQYYFHTLENSFDQNFLLTSTSSSQDNNNSLIFNNLFFTESGYPGYPGPPSELFSHSSLCHNHWLAGFIDGDGSLQIKIINRKLLNKTEVRLQLQIDLNETYKYLLDNIRFCFGGYIGYRQKLNSYYYNSTSFQVFIKLVNYLDHFSLCSNKYKEYVLWRKAYFFRKDINKMIKIKQTLSNLKR